MLHEYKPFSIERRNRLNLNYIAPILQKIESKKNVVDYFYIKNDDEN